MTTAYISIGNSDDKLSQGRWNEFTFLLLEAVNEHASAIHGVWFSLPNAQYQNMCICAVFDDEEAALKIRTRLAELARNMDQDGIAWAEVETTEFL